MSTYSTANSGEGPTITLTKNPDGRWTARDVEHDVSAQGETRAEALERLDEIVDALAGEGGREPTADELSELGVDPDENGPGGDPPDALK